MKPKISKIVLLLEYDDDTAKDVEMVVKDGDDHVWMIDNAYKLMTRDYDAEAAKLKAIWESACPGVPFPE